MEGDTGSAEHNDPARASRMHRWRAVWHRCLVLHCVPSNFQVGISKHTPRKKAKAGYITRPMAGPELAAGPPWSADMLCCYLSLRLSNIKLYNMLCNYLHRLYHLVPVLQPIVSFKFRNPKYQCRPSGQTWTKAWGCALFFLCRAQHSLYRERLKPSSSKFQRSIYYWHQQTAVCQNRRDQRLFA